MHIYKSRWQIQIPQVSLPSYVFTSPSSRLPDCPLFIDANRPETHILTYETYRLWSKRFAAGLIAAGLQPGDRVLLYSGNSIFFPVAIMGIIMAGGIFSGANPSYVARELAYQLQDSGAKFLMSSEDSIDVGLEAAKTAGLSKDKVFLFDDGGATFEGKGQGRLGVRHWSDLIASEEEGHKFKWQDLRSEEELNRTIALNYSSGTTGLPKGVEITHRNYVANAHQANHMTKLKPDYEELNAKSKWLALLPMYHAMGQAMCCVNAPLRRVPVYVLPKFDFIGMLECVQKFKITYMPTVPPILVAMAKHPATKKYDLSSLMFLASGAAPLPREVCNELEKTIMSHPEFQVVQGWGMTECTCQVTGWYWEDNIKDDAVGELVANAEARIMADDGVTDMPQGQPGEFWVRAPNIMKGYWNKPEATRETMTEDGWLKTGDIAYFDQKGRVHIVGRKKELIKVKGNQVAPAELEGVLLENPAIADVGVIGIPASDGNELPRAYVVLNGGQDLKPEDVQEWIKPQVAPHKRLTGGVRFVDAIPKNPSGKILRRFMHEWAKEEARQQGAKL